MPAKKRYVDAGEITHRSSSTIKVPIQFDRNELRFRASYAGKNYEHENAKELYKLVYQAIEESLDVPWQPVIQVKPLSPYGQSSMVDPCFVGFKIERFWTTRFPDGAYKSCQWDGKEKGYLLLWCRDFYWDKEKYGPFNPPVKVQSYGDITYYVPYSEETWDRLMFLQEKIKELRGQLLSLFETPEKLDRLFTSSILALPSGENA